MTPKEKAEELVDKFENYSFMDIDQKTSSFSTAKQCAIIAVDEIIKVLWHTHKNEIEFRYWQEVKQEIKLL